MNTDTPRTDAYIRTTPAPERWEIVDFAEKLERELNAANERIAKLEAATSLALSNCHDGPMPDYVRNALVKAKETKP